MGRLASGALKTVFGLFILFGVLLITLSSSVMDDFPMGILIPVAIIGWIVLKPRKGSAEQSIPCDSDLPEPKVGECLEGVGAQIEVRATGLAVTRSGASSLFIHGLKGEKFLPFKSITAVQFKEPTQSMSGYIQFSLQGGKESAAGIWDASKDENSVLFTRDQSPRFRALRNLVEDRLASLDAANLVPSQSRAQQLATLADLRARGDLTDDEFAAEKANLLAR